MCTVAVFSLALSVRDVIPILFNFTQLDPHDACQALYCLCLLTETFGGARESVSILPVGLSAIRVQKPICFQKTSIWHHLSDIRQKTQTGEVTVLYRSRFSFLSKLSLQMKSVMGIFRVKSSDHYTFISQIFSRFLAVVGVVEI